MKKHTMALALGLFALVGNLTACTQEASEATTEPADTASAQQDIITAPLGANLMAWPAGPIAWDGLVGTWPIAVWSPLPISMLAFDVAGVSSLTLGISTLNAAGTARAPGHQRPPDHHAVLRLHLGRVGDAVARRRRLLADARRRGPLCSGVRVRRGVLASRPRHVRLRRIRRRARGHLEHRRRRRPRPTGIGVSPFLTPAITTNALMFTNLAALTTMSPYLINVGFTGVAGLNSLMMGGLSLFASTAAANVMLTGTFPFTSLAFPIMSPLGVGLGSPLLL